MFNDVHYRTFTFVLKIKDLKLDVWVGNMFDSMHFLTFKLYRKQTYVLKRKSSRLMVPNENKFDS